MELSRRALALVRGSAKPSTVVFVRASFPLALVFVTACAGSASAPAAPTEGGSPVHAAAVLTSNAGVEGTVTFEQTTEGVRVLADVRGLEPGPHGFHIHETGDCSAADFKSAGGHFNPQGVDHGAPSDTAHHVGDLGNLQATDDGSATVDTAVELPASIVGKAVIIHASADDLKSQPSGAAGPRVACGVIEPRG